MGTVLGLAGDVMLGRGVDRRQRGRPATAVWGDLLDRLTALDGFLLNLECAVAESGTPWRRTDRPFHFRADPGWAIDALRAAGVDWVSLANNHALDFEEAALLETLEHLDGADIGVGGAGRDRAAACEPSRVDVGGLTLGVVALTDNTPEFGAGPDAPGTCQAALDASARDLLGPRLSRLAADGVDLLVASVHWGPNMVTRPTEGRRRFARWLVERGVDVVHGHSAHVFNGIEVIDGRPVLYDAGDFVDDYAVDGRLRNDRGFLFEVHLDDGGTPDRIELVPTAIEDCAVRRATGDAAAWCRRTMRERSSPFDTAFEHVGEGLALELPDG